jgi:transposase
MDHATLGDALRSTTAAEVSTLFRVSRRTIYRWCKQYGIPRRVYRCPNAELLRRLEEDGVLQKGIARAFGVSRWTIWRWCVRFGIAHHTTGQFRKGTKGNLPHIHEEMPFEIGVAFGDDLD